MCDVILFGGTSEGRILAEFLRGSNIKYIVCVATEYGAELLNGSRVRVGRMDEREMSEFFAETKPKIVVDATHPYADKVTENIEKACTCRYLRVTREETDVAFGVTVGSAKEAAVYLSNTSGEILLTTGSKEIVAFSALAARAYARVLPSDESVAACIRAGFSPERIISAAPPFTEEENIAVIREKNIKYLVTKSSGASGGFDAKIAAARKTGAECVIIRRPTRESGLSVEEVKKKITELIK